MPEDNENDNGGQENGGTGGASNQGHNDQLQGLLARHNNDWAAVAGQLFRDNYALREDRRGLRAEVKQLQAKVPDGAIVLSGDDLAAYQELKQLGDATALSTQLRELATLRRDAQVSELATHHKLKASAVKRLLAAEAVITAKGEGDKREFSVKTGDQEVSVKELLEGDWKEFVPALQEGAGSGGPKVLGQAGVEGKGDPDDIVGSYIKSQSGAGKAPSNGPSA